MSTNSGWTQAEPRRRDPRIKAALPVRVWGMDATGTPFVQTVTTLEISQGGVSVTGVTVRLNQGEIIGLQYGTEKARFRVSWIAPLERVGFSVGLENADEGKCLWSAQLAAPDQGTQAPTGDRRRSVRFPCNASAELGLPGKNYKMWGTVTDISSGGCYVQTVSTVPIGSIMELGITLGSVELHSTADVRASHPSIGMGMQFRTMSGADNQKLRAVLEQLESGQTEKISPQMRVLAQMERLREALGELDEVIRRDPNRLIASFPETIQRMHSQVTEMLRKQREVLGDNRLP